jgi:uncharacterized membrane protein
MLEERRHGPGRSNDDDAAPDQAPAPAEAASVEAEPVEAEPGQARPGPAWSPWRDRPAWLIAALVLGVYLVISLYKLVQLQPSSWDLGIYTEYVKQYADLHGPVVDVRGPGFNLLGDHFQVIVALIAPFFRVFPSPATLLVAQAVLTAVSVFPVISAASELLGRGTGRAIGFAYGFSWGLQQMINFDFHEIAFAVPLLAFSLSAFVRGRARPTIFWALPLVFVKEDQGFTVAALGILMWVASLRLSRLPGERPPVPPGRLPGERPPVRPGASPAERQGYRGRGQIAASGVGGTVLFCWGLGWSLLEIAWIIPHFSATHKYAYWSLGGVVGGGPAFSLGGLLHQVGHAYPVKLETLVMLALPTAFIALGSPLAAIVIPSLLLRFISTNDYYWGTLWHYNATAMPILFLAAIEAMSRWREAPDPPWVTARAQAVPLVKSWNLARRAASRHGAAMMGAIAVALAFQFPVANLWNGQTYQIGPHVVADRAAMAVVPSGASVTTTLNLLAPLGARCDTYWVGNNGNPDTQYIVFDGPNSGYSPAVTDVPAFIAQLYPKAGYQQVFSQDSVYVFRLP